MRVACSGESDGVRLSRMLRRGLHVWKVGENVSAHLRLRDVGLLTCGPEARHMGPFERGKVLVENVLVECVCGCEHFGGTT